MPESPPVIQTQTPINPGNSGGPLLDDQMRVVGINSFKSDGEGLNFAVAADEVQAFLQRKGDRTAQPPAGGAKMAAADCKPKVLEGGRSKEPVGNSAWVDDDCDGKGDFVLIVPDDEKLPIRILLDTDGDDDVDIALLDTDRDGDTDLSISDSDGDGKADLAGHYRDGEDEPYKWERISG